MEIAIIDSGINPGHPHVNGVAGGVSFRLDNRHNVVEHADFTDQIGHGTAVAGVIRQYIPQAALYGVKIFHEDLYASGSLLLAGLEWAIFRRKKIIHLSLGTEDETYQSSLEALCRKAYHQNIIVLAAGRSPQDTVLPAAFNTVIGVCRHDDCRMGDLVCHQGCNIEFGAAGLPRELPGVPRERNFQGHSFAVAHVTGQVAVLLAENPEAGPVWVKRQLIKRATHPDSAVLPGAFQD